MHTEKHKTNGHNVFRKYYVFLVLSLILFTIGTSRVLGQSYGKIAGTIEDAQTGETLIGANVVIEGTTQGASTNADGEYFILQVEPGTYNIKVSYVGYQTKVFQDVTVNSGQTTDLNAELQPQSYESEGEVVVTAEQGMVQEDVTNTSVSVDREQMEQMPGFESTDDIFRSQAGAVTNTGGNEVELSGGANLQVRDESVSNVHIRGGRGGEIKFLVDGMPANHPLYGGRSVMDLNVSDIKNMELITGAFSAEYGNAQSGVVKIQTRSGSENYSVNAQYKTDDVGMVVNSNHRHYGNFSLSGPEPITGRLLPALGVDIPGDIYIYASANSDVKDGGFNYTGDQYIGKKRPSYDVGGLGLTGKRTNKISVNGKLNYQLNGMTEFILSYNGSWHEWDGFSWLWKNNPNNTARSFRRNQNVTFQFRRTVSQSTFYSLKAQFLGVNYENNYQNTTPRQFWSEDNADSSLVQSPVIDPQTGFYDDSGVQTIWRDDATDTYTIKGDMTSQLFANHLVKTGFEVMYHDLQYIDIQGGGFSLSPYGRHIYRGDQEVPPPPGPFKPYGSNRWVFNTNPLQGAAYVQDKYELENLIVNAGIRADWFAAGPSVMEDDYKQVWEDATGLESDWKQLKYKISPRFGVSFPISTKTVIFFSYGHFYQLPELQFYYRDPYSGGLTGNPHLDYQETILYEFGLTHQFARNWAIDIKSYNRNVSQQVGTTRLRGNLGLPVSLWENKGYSRARGIETKLTKRYSNHTRGEVTYTVQWATGFSSSAFEGYIRSLNDFPKPIRENPLSIDIRHQIVFSGALTSPRQDPLRPFGFDLPAGWNLSVLANFSTGRPYTPGTVDPVERQQSINSKTGPVTLSADIKLRQKLNLAGVKSTIFFEVYNALDYINVNLNNGFNNWTGEPFKYGDRDAPSNRLYTWREMNRILDPRRLSIGRRFQFGMQISL